MFGRAMLSGPSGAGKTWTGLGMAGVLAKMDGGHGRVLLIDTEHDSALTYADVFSFHHLPWRPPYDPTELADTLVKLADDWDVVLVDSFTHFWRGLGGTLDIADGKFGGWKAARPIQERLVNACLGVNAHLLLCVRSKMEYLVEGGGAGSKQTVTKLGLAPVQDETLVYEMNIALDIDLEHRITVSKSRCAAVPVGRMFPAGMERKAAEDYADWLAGGIPPASREAVDRIVATLGQIADADERKRIKAEFVERFGMPHALTEAAVADVDTWLTKHLPEATDAAPTTPQDASQSPAATDTAPEPENATEPHAAAPEASAGPPPDALDKMVERKAEQDALDAARAADIGEQAAPPPAADYTPTNPADELPTPDDVDAMDEGQLREMLEELGLRATGRQDVMKMRLLAHVTAAAAKAG